mmetsp:Transcript_71480/g.225836  ORF Transcript_71480/g.225836 Transcript_71480/m.225836 type:complete len:386 (-) Transcript_71480:65-1222(-)
MSYGSELQVRCKSDDLSREFVAAVDSETPFVPYSEEFEYDPEPLTADLYGVGITSLIRDVRKAVTQKQDLGLRMTKALVAVLVLWTTVVVQLFLISVFRVLVVRSAVHKVRVMYGEYEEWMYANHTKLTKYGYRRGLPGFFDRERFAHLPQDIDMDFICSMPLSQPRVFMCIIVVWTLTVVIDLRKVIFYTELLLVRQETIGSVQGMLEHRQDHTVLLKGLTLPFKAMLLLVIFIPRFVIDIMLLWLGCQWLAATTSFSTLLLKAAGLQFMLLFKDTVYDAVVPKRNQWETGTMLVPHRRKTHPSWTTYMGAFVWAVLAIAWAGAYVYHFQDVLPEYQWDLQAVCQDYIDEITSLVNGIELDRSSHIQHPAAHHGWTLSGLPPAA